MFSIACMQPSWLPGQAGVGVGVSVGVGVNVGVGVSVGRGVGVSVGTGVDVGVGVVVGQNVGVLVGVHVGVDVASGAASCGGRAVQVGVADACGPAVAVGVEVGVAVAWGASTSKLVDVRVVLPFHVTDAATSTVSLMRALPVSIRRVATPYWSVSPVTCSVPSLKDAEALTAAPGSSPAGPAACTTRYTGSGAVAWGGRARIVMPDSFGVGEPVAVGEAVGPPVRVG
jgi:hypothetical protein